VFRRDTKQVLPKAYVKVYAKTASNAYSDQSYFFRDGFTDIRGMFAYASASGGTQTNDVTKFAVLVSHEELGQEIELINPPKQD